ncbi:PTS system mannose/fructose/N-acetylgalactosamine-transporter subunit IIB [Brevibacillus sp. B_LB10_24]|uniref:PTS system mannose/fructose/N-acetylgalactosamine-transporter subunit IIB n=1 Tax=Brevibacillus sp. B_LB10_24 TaxID=3380645 RepID=UPI0038BCE8DA
MAITVTRIDERLIHGQVAHSWSVEYRVDRLVVVDDILAGDEMQKMIMSLAVPAGKKHSFLSKEEAVPFLQNSESANEKIFLIVKKPHTLLYLVEHGVKIPSINVGGMYYAENKRQIAKTVYVSDEDVKVFEQLKDHGVACEIRTSPQDKSVNLFDLI